MRHWAPRWASSACRRSRVAATFVVVLGLSLVAFYAIKQTIGLRVSEDEELAGLDISSHGMYGYPEQFIPPELARARRASRTSPALRWRLGSGHRDQRQPAVRGLRGGDLDEEDRGIHSPRGVRADPDRAARQGFPSCRSARSRLGAPKGIVETYRGSSLTVNVRPKLKIEVVVEDKDKPVVVEAILKHARTGDVGDGKVFVIPVEEAIRIRTGEEGNRSSKPTEAEIPA